MFWPAEVVACIQRKWLPPDRLVSSELKQQMTRVTDFGETLWGTSLLTVECLFFVDTIVRTSLYRIAYQSLACHQLLRFEKWLALERHVSASCIAYTFVVSYRRIPNEQREPSATLDDIDHHLCNVAGVVFKRPNGQPDIVNGYQTRWSCLR